MLGTCEAIGNIDGVTGSAFTPALRAAIDSSDAALVYLDCSGPSLPGALSVSADSRPGPAAASSGARVFAFAVPDGQTLREIPKCR